MRKCGQWQRYKGGEGKEGGVAVIGRVQVVFASQMQMGHSVSECLLCSVVVCFDAVLCSDLICCAVLCCAVLCCVSRVLVCPQAYVCGCHARQDGSVPEEHRQQQPTRAYR